MWISIYLFLSASYFCCAGICGFFCGFSRRIFLLLFSHQKHTKTKFSFGHHKFLSIHSVVTAQGPYQPFIHSATILPLATYLYVLALLKLAPKLIFGLWSSNHLNPHIHNTLKIESECMKMCVYVSTREKSSAKSFHFLSFLHCALYNICGLWVFYMFVRSSKL